jgi:hypothetical protein
MLTLLDPAITVQFEELAELFALAPDPAPEAPGELEPTLPLDEWVMSQASLYRSPLKLDEATAPDGELTLELVANALQDLATGLRFQGCNTPGEYRYDLAIVSVPDNRASYLAGALDEEARAFLALDTDCGRLCAAAILAAAEDAEELRADSAVDYLRKLDQRDMARRDALAADMAFD